MPHIKSIAVFFSLLSLITVSPGLHAKPKSQPQLRTIFYNKNFYQCSKLYSEEKIESYLLGKGLGQQTATQAITFSKNQIGLSPVVLGHNRTIMLYTDKKGMRACSSGMSAQEYSTKAKQHGFSNPDIQKKLKSAKESPNTLIINQSTV